MDKEQVLMNFWKRLTTVNRLTFCAKTKSNGERGWDGNGVGNVDVVKHGDNILIFNEKGTWKGRQKEEFHFRNVFRWTLDRDVILIGLEHLRLGVARPVFLLNLVPIDYDSLSSATPHLCGEDVYIGQLRIEAEILCLNWQVIGPKKNEEIDYFYS